MQKMSPTQKRPQAIDRIATAVSSLIFPPLHRFIKHLSNKKQESTKNALNC